MKLHMILQKFCKKAGKRVCSAKEWIKACKHGTPAADKCNIGGSKKKSGSMKGCVTKDGVYDMIGNMVELTSDRELRGNSDCTNSTKRFQARATDGTRCCAYPKLKPDSK